ncbi:MAG: ATP-dependent helicase, partial [Crenarchaeota archaeon]|nr:ATP-dependent helicase [Thermoproteota archaeon]
MIQKPTNEQLEIINHKDGHLLVLAGPGSGKTFTLVERVQKLASYNNIDEDEILCITFTEKATEEMSDRLAKLGNTKTKVSTFHAFCKEICTENSVKSGLTTDSQLITEELMKLWAIRNSDSFGLDEKIINFVKDAANGNAGIFGGMNSAITNFKESLITSAELQSWLEKQREEIKKIPLLEIARQGNIELIDYVDTHFEFNKVYAAYEKFLRENSRFDYSDLIRMAIELFKNHPTILESYKKKYRYILVDEFQDNNFSQYEVVRLLGQDASVMVVGDDDQLIMRFQGAREKNFDAFQTEFADVTVKKLTKNFRSTKQIVEFANLFTNKILYRQPKQNTSVRDGEKVKIVRPTSGKAQIEYVVKTIRSLLGKQYINKDGEKAVYDYGDFAILSRQRKWGRDFVDELKTYDIPTTFRGDYNMFESPIIAEVLQYIHIIQSPSSAGMWFHKIMINSGIDDVNIRIIGEEANKRRWKNERVGIDETFEVMKDCDSLDISQKQEIKEIVKKFQSAIEEDAKGTVAETVYKIIYTDLSGVYKHCSAHDDRLGILMLNKFYEQTLDFENLWPERTIQEFDKHLKFMRQVEIDLEDSSILKDTVQVMTMHKAKGKEYPI